MDKLCHSNAPRHRCTGQHVTSRVARATDSKDSHLPRVLKMGNGPIMVVLIVKVTIIRHKLSSISYFRESVRACVRAPDSIKILLVQFCRPANGNLLKIRP